MCLFLNNYDTRLSQDFIDYFWVVTNPSEGFGGSMGAGLAGPGEATASCGDGWQEVQQILFDSFLRTGRPSKKL
jgi:hypothetical protein